jgi:hypothetical protein
MLIKNEKGVTGIDIVVSVIIITIFIALIANLIATINLNSSDIEKKTQATSYAVEEIEKIKADGYIANYENKGIDSEETLLDEDINNNDGFTGYHKTVKIKDYILIKEDTSKEKNILKEITVEISYKSRKDTESVKISTYITSED